MISRSLAFGVFGLALTAQPASAKPAAHDFHLLRGGPPGSISFWDDGAETRDGDSIDARIFVVGQHPFFNRYRLSCVWRTEQELRPPWGYDEAEKPVASVGPVYFNSQNRPDGALRSLMDDVCDPGADQGDVRFSTTQAAIAYARSRLAAPPPMVIAVANKQPNIETVISSPLAFIFAGANASIDGRVFVNASGPAKEGASIERWTAWVLSARTPAGYPSIELRLSRFNCDAGTESVLKEYVWDSDERFIGVSYIPRPVRPLGDSKVARAVVHIACEDGDSVRALHTVKQMLMSARSEELN